MSVEPKPIHIQNKEESQLCSGLYLVCTPVGNLRDMTLRSLDVLNAADYIVCEDSRVTGKLLKAYQIGTQAKKVIYNDHSDDVTKDYILDLAKNNVVAMVSDAGAPLISDPGYKLVRDASLSGVYVTALPGANALIPALQLSGLPTNQFVFAGFLPSKPKAVKDALMAYQYASETVAFYEAPHRIAKTLDVINNIFPQRTISIVREISKVYEEVLSGIPHDVIVSLEDRDLKGEIVLILGGCDSDEGNTDDMDIDGMIVKALSAGQSLKELSADIASMVKAKKKDIYARALVLKGDSEGY